MLLELNDTTLSATTFAFGGISIFIRPCRRYWRIKKKGVEGKCWNTAKAITDFLNGASTVPFICLAASSFHPAMLALVTANKVSLTVAGVIGLFAVLGEVLSAGRED